LLAASSSLFDPYRKSRTFDEGAASRRTKTYRDFFTPITALAIEPLLDAIRLQVGVDLLDVATGPSSLAAETRSRMARKRFDGAANIRAEPYLATWFFLCHGNQRPEPALGFNRRDRSTFTRQRLCAGQILPIFPLSATSSRWR
jgi:hypothetical protein